MNAPFTATYVTRDLWDLGYRDLCSIVPPGALIKPKSSLIGKPTGKIPGWRTENGQWIGYDWLGKVSPERWLEWWADWNCGTGIKPGTQPDGSHLLAIDADTLDEERAGAIKAKVVEHFGLLPTRVGKAPKALYLLRTAEPMRSFKLRFEDEPNADPNKPGKVGQVEMLAGRTQFIASGIHPDTMRPYTWTVPLVPIADLPVFTAEQVEAFLVDIRPLLPKVGEGLRGFAGAGDRLSDYSNVDQAELRAPSLDMLAEAVRAIPNEAETTRDDYRNLGLAIHAAAAQDLDFGRELFVEWALRWPGGKEDANLGADALGDWSRFKAPHLIGWGNYIRPKAEKAGWHCLDGFDFDDEGDPKPDDPKPDDEAEPKGGSKPKKRKIRPSPWVYQDPTTMPMLRFVYGKHYMRTVLSATFAAGETGKSSLSLVEAVSMATGRDLLGKGLSEGRVRVWVWNGEDDLPLLNKRVAAICLNYGIKREELEGWLFLDSGVDTPLCVAKQGRNGVELQQEDLDMIRDGIREMGIDVWIADPFISMHEVPESDNTGIGMVVKALSKITAETSTAGDLVHHVRKAARGQAAEVELEDGRGAGSFKDKIRSGRVLGKMTAAEGKKVGIDRPRGYFWVKNGKQNLAPPPPDVRDWYRLAGVKLGNDPKHPSSPDDVFHVGGDDIGVVEKWEYPVASDGVDDADLVAVKRVVAAGEYRRDGQATAWVGKAVAEALKLNIHDPVDKAKVVGLLKQWLASGDLKTEDRPDVKSNVRTFVVVGRP